MRLAAIALACAATATAASAQSAADPVARHRDLYQSIERDLATYRHAEADMDTLGLERQSTEGGRLQAYCDRDTIRLLIAEYDGETGNLPERFYFDGARLVRWLGPKNVAKSVRSSAARDETRDLLADARRLRAVMPACQPKYAPQ
ncbi:MAG TPA: hypothetical protein VGP25_13715 [Gemmatimonadaceae bacterium]|jgi:hypothetical protein|nr:hypothetical protein [Gemmatimonadaceae bacterium]